MYGHDITCFFQAMFLIVAGSILAIWIAPAITVFTAISVLIALACITGIERIAHNQRR